MLAEDIENFLKRFRHSDHMWCHMAEQEHADLYNKTNAEVDLSELAIQVFCSKCSTRVNYKINKYRTVDEQLRAEKLPMSCADGRIKYSNQISKAINMLAEEKKKQSVNKDLTFGNPAFEKELRARLVAVPLRIGELTLNHFCNLN